VQNKSADDLNNITLHTWAGPLAIALSSVDQLDYKASDEIENGADLIDWGGTSSKKMNEWVTADVLYVLKSADLTQPL